MKILVCASRLSGRLALSFREAAKSETDSQRDEQPTEALSDKGSGELFCAACGRFMHDLTLTPIGTAVGEPADVFQPPPWTVDTKVLRFRPLPPCAILFVHLCLLCCDGVC